MTRPPRSRPDSTNDDAALFAALTAFVTADKALSAPVHWIDTDGDLRFTATLEIGGLTEEALLLFGRATASIPDAAVTLGLRWTGAPGRYSHFDRLDWRPVDAHTNKGMGPVDLRFRLIEGTHHHRLAQNAVLELGLLRAMAENLPIAEPVLPEPASWEAFLAIAAQRWRIHDLVTTPYPPWQYGLLPLTGGEARGAKDRG
ncbi:MAG TPA: hypothetical protein DDZ81_03075 [Acetobacteraceae bacterium]|jgi:hypothetical protein|nr:hypothetical protein [Acetobacteraceae bacterium]